MKNDITRCWEGMGNTSGVLGKDVGDVAQSAVQKTYNFIFSLVHPETHYGSAVPVRVQSQYQDRLNIYK